MLVFYHLDAIFYVPLLNIIFQSIVLSRLIRNSSSKIPEVMFAFVFLKCSVHETPVVASQDDLMDIDDPVEVPPRRHPLSVLPEASAMNPFSLLDPQFRRSLFDGGSDFMNHAPFVSHPRERREIPIEVKDGNDVPSHSGHAPIIEDVTGTEYATGPDIRGTIIVDEDDNDIPADRTGWAAQRAEKRGDSSGGIAHESHSRPSAPEFDKLPDYSNDIEEEMIRAAIEASKQEAQVS